MLAHVWWIEIVRQYGNVQVTEPTDDKLIFPELWAQLQEVQLWGDLGMYFSVAVSSFSGFEHIEANVCNVVKA